jgi:hypothetical protein
MRFFLFLALLTACRADVDDYQFTSDAGAGEDIEDAGDTATSSADVDTDTDDQVDTDTDDQVDTDTDTATGPACAGIALGGVCWYMGNKGEPCSLVCAGRGGYNEATRTMIGSDGSDDACLYVLEALGKAGLFNPDLVEPEPVGCCAQDMGPSQFRTTRVESPPTTATAQAQYKYRACGCNA